MDSGISDTGPDFKGEMGLKRGRHRCVSWPCPVCNRAAVSLADLSKNVVDGPNAIRPEAPNRRRLPMKKLVVVVIASCLAVAIVFGFRLAFISLYTNLENSDESGQSASSSVDNAHEYYEGSTPTYYTSPDSEIGGDLLGIAFLVLIIHFAMTACGASKRK